MAGGGGPSFTPVPAYEWGEEWRDNRAYTAGQTVTKTFKGREYTYVCQAEITYGYPPFPFVGTVLVFPSETDPEEPDFNGSKAYYTNPHWNVWKPIVPEWKEGEVYRHGHSVTMNGNIYIASLRYEYLIPPENYGTTQNPNYNYMRDARQEEQGPLLDVDREEIRTWVLAAPITNTRKTYQHLQVWCMRENELYHLPAQGYDNLTEANDPNLIPGLWGVGAYLFDADRVVSHPYSYPESVGSDVVSYDSSFLINNCVSKTYFQHILLQEKDKQAPNGQFIAKDPQINQSRSADANAGWNSPPTDQRKLVGWWYGPDGDPVYSKPAKYYTGGGELDEGRNAENWEGEYYWKDKGVLDAEKCGYGFQSSGDFDPWPSQEFYFFDGNEETGAGTWYYDNQLDPGRPNLYWFIHGEHKSVTTNPPTGIRDTNPSSQLSSDRGLGNNILPIGYSYGFVVNHKEKPKRPDGSNYYDYDENGDPTSWTDEDGNVNQGELVENEDGTTDWVYRNENGDDVGKPTDEDGKEVEPRKDKWLRTTEGQGNGVFPSRLESICYQRKEDPLNTYAPFWVLCTTPPKKEDGSNIYEYNSDGTVTGWTDDDGNTFSVVTNGDGTFTGYDSNGDEVDLPPGGEDPYQTDLARKYTAERPAYPPDDEPWKRDHYFYFRYNHGVYGGRTVEVEVEAEITQYTYNERELSTPEFQHPILYSPDPLPPYKYQYKFITWRPFPGTVEWGYCLTGGFRAGSWKKISYPNGVNPSNTTFATFPPYYYVWDYPPPGDCKPHIETKKTTKKFKKQFKIEHRLYTTLDYKYNFVQGSVEDKYENLNKNEDGAPDPGSGLCMFVMDINREFADTNTEYTWRLSKVKFVD
jgi:hypothetical protein